MATQRRYSIPSINLGSGSSGGGSLSFDTSKVQSAVTEAQKAQTIESAKTYNPVPGKTKEQEVVETPVEENLSPEELADTQTQVDSDLARIDDRVSTLETAVVNNYNKLADPNLSVTDQTALLISTQAISNELKILRETQTALKAEAKEAEEKGGWKSVLSKTGDVLKMLAGGALVVEGLKEIFGDDEMYQGIDGAQTIEDNLKTITNPDYADAIIDASYRDNPRLTDLENLSAYRNTYGSLSGDFFNDPNYGQTLQEAYQEALKIDPDLNADQFLVEFADQNPTNPIAQQIRYSMSRMGQVERSTNSLFEIDRGVTLRGLDSARKFYTPTPQGGYGFSPDDFRTKDQSSMVRRAMGLANDPFRDQLKERVARRLETNGRLRDDELRDITSSALTSVDPSLQNQAYLRNGGLARSVLNTGQAMRNRMLQDEGSLLGIMADERAGVTTANSVVNSNTFDPTRAFGLSGSNTGSANQIYQSNPTTGINYDPTSSYFSSIAGYNANIANANRATPSTSSSINKVTEGIEGLAG